MISTLLLLTLSCGSERWAIKTLADAEAKWIPPPNKTQGSVAEAIALIPPKKWTLGLSRQPAELIAYTITATVVSYKLEDDEDYHVVLSDGHHTMIAEIPSERCWPPAKEVRAQFDALFPVKPTAKLYKLPKPGKIVTMTGVLFFDKLHGQTGVAPNGIELHPVQRIWIEKPKVAPEGERPKP